MWEGLEHLDRLLDVSNNRIRTIHHGAFGPLHNLPRLWLHNNDIRTLTRLMFEDDNLPLCTVFY